MRVIYAMRLDGPTWSADHTATVRRMVTDWVEEEYPFAERAAGITVRFDNDDPDRWWRLTVDRGLADKAVATSTVTVATDASGTAFEVRTVVVPGGHRIQLSLPDVPIVAPGSGGAHSRRGAHVRRQHPGARSGACREGHARRAGDRCVL